MGIESAVGLPANAAVALADSGLGGEEEPGVTIMYVRGVTLFTPASCCHLLVTFNPVDTAVSMLQSSILQLKSC